SAHYTTDCPRSPFCVSSRRRHTRSKRDWSSDVCSSDLLKSRGLKSWWNFSADGLNNIFGVVCLLPFASLDSKARSESAQAETSRSEERRVGKEGKDAWMPEQQREQNDGSGARQVI